MRRSASCNRPRLPIHAPRAGVATSSPNGVTRFWSGTNPDHRGGGGGGPPPPAGGGCGGAVRAAPPRAPRRPSSNRSLREERVHPAPGVAGGEGGVMRALAEPGARAEVRLGAPARVHLVLLHRDRRVAGDGPRECRGVTEEIGARHDLD